MKSNQVKKFDATQFEVLQTKGEVLKGGFSTTFFSTSAIGGTDVNVFSCGTTNTNCRGGNCVAGCGGTPPVVQ